MDLKTVREVLLRGLYTARFNSDRAVNLNQVCLEKGWDTPSFWKMVDRIQDEGLIVGYTMGGNYIITQLGLAAAEKNGWVDFDERIKNQHARNLVMQKLMDAYEQSSQYTYELDVRQLIDQSGMEPDRVLANVECLGQSGYLQEAGGGFIRVSAEGITMMEQRREKQDLIDEYEEIGKMNPQARGRRFQKFVAKIAEVNGWMQEEGARTENEELDVVIHKGREYYLIECKWEKDSIEAAAVRELYGKLSNRAAVNAILVSMSGFTTGAIQQAESLTGQKVMLFFGKEDVESLASFAASFDELLDHKFHESVTRRRIVYR